MKVQTIQTFILSLPLLAWSTIAMSEITEWKKVGWWQIDFYSASAGCSAYANYDGGIAFFIGLDGVEGLDLEVVLANNDWKSIEQDKEYSVSVVFGDESPWDLSMYGMAGEEFRGLKLQVDASSEKAGQFVNEFMKEVNMEWTYEGVPLGKLSLQSSRQAFNEAVSCTKSYRDAIQSTTDPFSTSNQSKDPFQ